MIKLQGNPYVKYLERKIYSIDCSPDNRIVCGLGNKVRIYDLKTFIQIGSDMIGHRDIVMTVKYSPKGDLIASGGNDHMIFIWDSKTQLLFFQIVQYDSWINCLSFSPEGHYLASGSTDRSIQITNISQLSPIQAKLRNKNQDWLNEIHYSANGFKLISCSLDQNILLWDLRYLKAKKIQKHKNSVRSVKYIHNQVVISNGKDQIIKIWLERNGKQIRKFKRSAYISALSSDTKYHISADIKTKKLTLQNLESGQIIGKPQPTQSEEITCLLFTPDGKHAISGSHDKALRITNLDVFLNLEYS